MLKKTFCLFVLCLCTMSVLSAQEAHNVSTKPAGPSILIEEFTAIHCSYCPQAHEISNNLTYLFPNKIHVIAVHASNLAVPAGDEIDLRTQYGDTLHKLQGESGMPSGNINRTRYGHLFGENYGAGYSAPRSEWSKICKHLLSAKDTAAVNLWTEAVYDATSGNITIDVEAYILKEIKGDIALNISLTETFVRGTQMGSGLTDYLHRHVLRDIVTGINGETIVAAEISKGSYIKKTYTYKLPEKFNNRVPKPENMECVVFITNDSNEIINTTAKRVSTQIKDSLDYAQIGLKRLKETYASSLYDVYLVNPSDDTIRSLVFDFTLNGKKEKVTIDNVICLPRTETILKMETGFKEWSKKNIYSTKVIKANGKDIKSNNVSGSYDKAKTLSCKAFKVSFKTDMFGSENEFFVRDQDQNVLSHKGPFEDGESLTYTSELITAEKGKEYTIDFIDSFRDGLSGEGYYVLLTENDSVFYRGTVGMYGDIVAFALQEDLSLEDNNKKASLDASLQPNPAKDFSELTIEGYDSEKALISIYSLQGALKEKKEVFVQKGKTIKKTIDLKDYNQGIYLVRIEQKNRHIVLKLIVKK